MRYVTKAQNNEIDMEDMKKLQKILPDKTKPITWVFVGDSITHGACHTHGWRSYPEHFAERIRCESQRYSDVVINNGVTNDTTKLLLNAWKVRVACFKPDVVSIMEGMNDCAISLQGAASKEDFTKNLREMVSRVRKSGAIPLLQTMNTITSDQQRKDLPAYVDVIRSVARREKAILVDNYEYWEKGKQPPSNPLKWLNDAIHPNELGHRAIAHELFRALDIFDDKSPTCSLPL